MVNMDTDIDSTLCCFDDMIDFGTYSEVDCGCCRCESEEALGHARNEGKLELFCWKRINLERRFEICVASKILVEIAK